MAAVPAKPNPSQQAASADKAAAALMGIFPTLTATFTGGATAGLTVALPITNCDNTAVFACSYPSAQYPGIPAPLWFANTFFNDRFVQFDRAANVVGFSGTGVTACAGGFTAVA
jgi:hypothetical protein